MRIIGLTGGIASGKSTVSAILRDLGATILDADAIYHDLIRPDPSGPSPLALRIARRFDNALQPDGAIDRQALGRRVFGDPQALSALGAITHPAVAVELGLRIEGLRGQGFEAIVYDVPLLYERGLETGMHGVIVVWVPRQVQLERLMRRESIESEVAVRRVDSQLSLDDKRERARWVIDNSGTEQATRSQIRSVWPELMLT